MTSPPASESYFDSIKDWLAKQPQRTRDAKRRGGLKAVRVVSEQLANQTRNRIRAAKADWQPLRWRIRHKVTEAVAAIQPTFHLDGIQGLVGSSHRLTLAHTLGDRLRLQATLNFLNDRVDHRLSPRCYGNRPNGTRNCTDRRTAVTQFQRLVWTEGKAWVAKLDVKNFYDTLPHGPVLAALQAFVRDRGCVREIAGYLAWYWEQCWPGHPAPPPDPVGLPQGSPVSAVLANIYMTAFDKALTAAGIEHIRFLDDVTIVARSPEQLAAQLELAMHRIEALGLTLAPKKTFVAYLGPAKAGGTSHPTTITLPTRGDRLQVHREFDELGVHFYVDGTFRARHRTVSRLLSKVRQEIRRDRKKKSPIARYLRATAAINRMLGYKVGFRRPGTKPRPGVGRKSKQPAAFRGFTRRHRVRTVTTYGVTVDIQHNHVYAGDCWIGGVRYVQPRQHALLGHSDLTMAQMHRVDRTIQRWMSREFGAAIRDASLTPDQKAGLKGRRVRSAAKMFEMAAREPAPECPGDRP